MRVVLDTNVIIDGFSDDFSAPAQLIEAACEGRVTALVTPAIRREYQRILKRLIADPEYRQRSEQFMHTAEEVTPQSVDVQIDDAEDIKFITAAVGGEADLIVTSDRHLLDIGEVEAVDMVTPQECLVRVQEESGGASEWEEWASSLGIGEEKHD